MTVVSNSFIERLVLVRERVSSFDEYPFSIPSIRNLYELAIHPKVTFFVGENGAGKSTLLEAIAIVQGFNPEGGSRNFNFSTHESHSQLCNSLRLHQGNRRLRKSDGYFFRAESFFNVATEIDREFPQFLGAYGGRSLHKQSHGESFFSLVLNRFRGNGLYILDEPEAALSPSRQMAMLTAMHDLISRGSQFIIATHSPIIMAYPDATIYQLSTTEIAQVAYEETEHYRLSKLFLTQKDQMLKELLGEL